MLKRLNQTGVNLAVLGVAVAVFAGAFCALSGFAASQRPSTVTVLVAARSIPLGAVISRSDVMERTVYEDENTPLYIPADEVETVVGGVAALPLFAGQPLYRSALIAEAGKGHRLSAALGQFSDHSLFPISLDASNVIAPDAEAFLPGDLVGVTVVIGARPQPPVTPTPDPFFLAPSTVISSTVAITMTELERGETAALERSFPPLAKDLFPQGVLVIAVQGLSQTQAASGEESEANSRPSFSGLSRQKTLILLIPNESRELLSLGMQRADRVFISLLARGGEQALTPGFTYWDFEDLFQNDRERYLDGHVPGTPELPGP